MRVFNLSGDILTDAQQQLHVIFQNYTDLSGYQPLYLSPAYVFTTHLKKSYIPDLDKKNKREGVGYLHENLGFANLLTYYGNDISTIEKNKSVNQLVSTSGVSKDDMIDIHQLTANEADTLDRVSLDDMEGIGVSIGSITFSTMVDVAVKIGKLLALHVIGDP